VNHVNRVNRVNCQPAAGNESNLHESVNLLVPHRQYFLIFRESRYSQHIKSDHENPIFIYHRDVVGPCGHDGKELYVMHYPSR